jgi:hypothetical protein
MKATVTAAKFQQKYDLNGTVETENPKRDDDVQKRTFKYLSDYFWSNISS